MPVTKTPQFRSIAGITDFTLNIYPKNGGAVINLTPLACTESVTTPGLYQASMTAVVASTLTTYGAQILKAGSQWADYLVDLVEAVGYYDCFDGPTVGQITAGGITGANPVTITVQTTGSVAIQNATVSAWSGTLLVDTGITNVSGVIALALNDGTYTIVVTAAGYVGSSASLVVSGSTPHTYQLTAIAITPSTPPEATGWLLCLDNLGVALAGIVHVVTQIGPADGSTGVSFSKQSRSAQSGSDGLVVFTGLVSGAAYYIQRGANGTQVRFVADTVTFELPDVLG